MSLQQEGTLLSCAAATWDQSNFEAGQANLTQALYEIACRVAQNGGACLWPSDFFMSLNIPAEFLSAFQHMEPWELRMETLCIVLLRARRAGEGDVAALIAERISKEIASLLTQGKWTSIRTLSDGLLNLSHGKRFKNVGGRRQDARMILPLVAFFILKKSGVATPSQKEVMSLLKSTGFTFSRDNVSKCFDKFGLRSQDGDSRTARHRSQRKG